MVVPTFLDVAVNELINFPSLKSALYARLFYLTLDITYTFPTKLRLANAYPRNPKLPIVYKSS